MTDAKDAAALAERLEQLRRAAIALLEVGNLVDLEHRKPYLDHAKYLQDIASELAALRQSPQEERSAWFECVQCGVSKTVEDQGDDLVCATCWREFQQAKPQAPEERPDMIALVERLREVYSQAAFDNHGKTVAVSAVLDRVLSALRAQPATKVTIRHRKSPPFYATED